MLEDYTSTQSATTSSYPLATKTRDINNAYANFMSIAISSCGKWQMDDTNQTDYPIVYFSLVANQDNYAFNLDESGNQILQLGKARIKDANGLWFETEQIDRTEFDISQFQNITGVPQYHDVTSNGIIFYPTPNYSSTNGGELYVSRTPVYFESTDTTDKPGIPDMFHEYLVIRPAYFYSLVNGLKQAVGLGNEMLKMEAKIKNYYAGRNKDYTNIITPNPIFSIWQ